MISPTGNPLVALFSVPPTNAGSVYVQFTRATSSPSSWQETSPQVVIPGQSTNIVVADMDPNTAYLMRYVTDSGVASSPLGFTTGSLPSNLNFPSDSVLEGPNAGTDLAAGTLMHFAVGVPKNTVATFATDLAGQVVWFYNDHGQTPELGTSISPGGTILAISDILPSGAGDGASVEAINLAGDVVQKTNIYAVNAELAGLGDRPVVNFDHDAQLLPNGDTAVVVQMTKSVNGVNYLGSGVVVLDRNFQVQWYWDPFQHLSTSELSVIGDGPGDWMHGNSIDWSPTGDGDLIMSVRSLDTVIKIDYANGSGDGHVVWQLGGQDNNFTLAGVPPGTNPAIAWFSHQHDARYINNSTLVLFDDGDTRVAQDPPPQDSRGQEWAINEQTMTATLVINVDVGSYSGALGSAQRLPDGDLTFTSGLAGTSGGMVETSPAGVITYVNNISTFQYRSYAMDGLYGPATGLVDPGFQDPPLTAGGSQADVAGSAWAFQGPAGEVADGNSLTNGLPSPQAGQAAYLEAGSSVNQAVNVSSSGAYQISLEAATGAGVVSGDFRVQVRVNGVMVDAFTPGASYSGVTTPSIYLPAGNHAIEFQAVGASGTALLDQVDISNANPTLQTDIWYGGTSSDWGDANNWSDGVPGLSSLVQISNPTAGHQPTISFDRDRDRRDPDHRFRDARDWRALGRPGGLLGDRWRRDDRERREPDRPGHRGDGRDIRRLERVRATHRRPDLGGRRLQ